MTKDIFQGVRAYTTLYKLSDEEKRLCDMCFDIPLKLVRSQFQSV